MRNIPLRQDLSKSLASTPPTGTLYPGTSASALRRSRREYKMILLDTNVVVGIVDQRDDRRPLILAELARLRKPNFLVCWPVLTETLHFLKRPDQRKYLRELLVRLNVSLAETYYQPTMDDVFAWMGRYGDHRPDFTDAYIVCLSAGNARWRVWTYDSEFHHVWRRPDGSAVPMVVKG